MPGLETQNAGITPEAGACRQEKGGGEARDRPPGYLRRKSAERRHSRVPLTRSEASAVENLHELLAGDGLLLIEVPGDLVELIQVTPFVSLTIINFT